MRSCASIMFFVSVWVVVGGEGDGGFTIILWRERGGEDHTSSYIGNTAIILSITGSLYDDATAKRTCHSYYIELTPPGKGISVSIERINSVL